MKQNFRSKPEHFRDYFNAKKLLYIVFGKYNACMGHFDTKVDRFMRKMIVDNVVVGVAHIAMS